MTQRAIGGHSRFTGGEGGSNIGWRWDQISLQEFAALRSPKITVNELSDWNRMLEENLAMDLMRDGMSKLLSVFEAAER
jgi:hypothetical protein